MSNKYAKSLVVVRELDSLRRRVHDWRRDGLSVVLVPTMGALHEGHIKLMEQAKKMADRVVATIFINPKQFGPDEDFSSYPRQEADDFETLDVAGVHLLFAPEAEVMYPPGFATTISVAGISDILDGQHRDGHFIGVATVVAKLLLQSLPDIALFGEKDYQQLVLIRRFVKDLNIPVDIIGAPTVRDPDGLAMSSRNSYLSTEQRAKAPILYATITEAAAEIARSREIMVTIEQARQKLISAGFDAVDYVEARQADNLAPLKSTSDSGRVLAAVRLGHTRLIDNVAVPTR
ncbi:MAG TPA: pantoate--beta-alanine ligase [Rhodospirillaceae bacterium]|nr:pantoate--beta-alanine ligase [Candidatus Neomarinimicrobiota bacterium]HCX14366.1 pantoate--beta-alanine ligase [Rhodospirillaceae bacterium]